MVDVSIIICTRNRAGQLTQALDAIGQMRCVHEWEAIIVDNASSDATADVIAAYSARDPRFRHVHEAEPGLGAARDTAWRQATGSIISFTDDDCYVAPDFVDCVTSAFRERPESGYLGGRILLHDPTDAPVTILTRDSSFDIAASTYIAAGVVQGANLSFRRHVLEAIDGLSRDMGAGTPFPCEDIDAVASAAWAGYAGGYDPRPTVSHHHGRKLADIPRLIEGYDAGRAAYFAKFIARRESRSAYVRGFLRQTSLGGIGADLIRARRYLMSGSRYLHKCGAPLTILLFIVLVLMLAAQSVLRRVLPPW